MSLQRLLHYLRYTIISGAFLTIGFKTFGNPLHYNQYVLIPGIIIQIAFVLSMRSIGNKPQQRQQATLIRTGGIMLFALYIIRQAPSSQSFLVNADYDPYKVVSLVTLSKHPLSNTVTDWTIYGTYEVLLYLLGYALILGRRYLFKHFTSKK